MTRKRRSSNPGLARYLAQIAARPVLTAEEEALAVERARESDDAGAPNALVESSLAFVVQTAKEFRDYGVPFEDLVNEGNLGLIEAAHRFELGRGARFLTYARWWIRKALLRALADQARVVRLPEYQLRKARESRETESTLRGDLGRIPTEEEIQDHLARGSRGRAGRASVHISEVSLDAPQPGTEWTFADRLEDRGKPTAEDEMIRTQSLRMVLDAMEDLSEQQRRVLSRRYGLAGERALSLKAVGQILSLSHERVRQIEEEALDLVRQTLGRKRGRGGSGAKRLAARASRRPAAKALARAKWSFPGGES